MKTLLKPCPMCGKSEAFMRTSYDTDGSDYTRKYIECKLTGWEVWV